MAQTPSTNDNSTWETIGNAARDILDIFLNDNSNAGYAQPDPNVSEGNSSNNTWKWIAGGVALAIVLYLIIKNK